MSLTNEPVLIGAAATVVASLLARFGFHVSADQLTAVAAAVAAVVGVVVRTFVTPAKKTESAPSQPPAATPPAA